jgi:Flp pilus assembly protein TadB
VRRTPRPVVITDAEQSPAEELRHRQNRYILMMTLRACCLIAAAVLAMLRVPLLGLWVVILLVGAVVLPWLAVILANDRAPKAQYRLANRFRRGAVDTSEPAQPTLPARPEPTVIDADQ